MAVFDAVEKERREENILWLFDLALWLKAMNGVLEVLGAFLVLAVPPALVLKVAAFLTGGELAQDPDDLIAAFIQSAAHSFAIHTHYLLALYLFVHGAAKILLVMGIFAGKRIAYSLFMLALVVFGSYEAYRGFVRHELLLSMLAAFDFMLLVLTAYEFRRRYPSPAAGDDHADR